LHRRGVPIVQQGGVMAEKEFTRREFLKRAGAGAAVLGAAGAGAPFSFAGPMKFKGRWLSGNLSLLTWIHFVPSYDQWLDPWAKAWGEKNNVQVNIEHINNGLLDTRAAAEVAAQSGHDLFFNLHPMSSYEDQVIDHDSIMALIAFMMCFGSFIQNADNHPTLLSKNTIDAVKFMAEIAQGETNDIYSWNGNPAGNNNYLYSGTASLILNAISATRTPESGVAGGQYADDLSLWPI